MINAPQVVIDALKSKNFSYANLVTVNLGDAYGDGNDVVLYLTDYGHQISFGGHNFTPDHNLTEIDGISRKASTGSDKVDIVFSVTDGNLIDAIKSERYINKPTSIDRVVIQNGAVVGDFSIPVRTAWGLSHSVSGDQEDRSITLTIDSTLGDLDGDNGWYAINASHERRYSGDKIMKHSGSVMTEDQQKRYTANFSGVINEQNKPPALSKIYGYKSVDLVPICMLKHRKTHTSYRHYFTTMIYAVNIGDCNHIDINNLRKDDEAFDFTVVNSNSRDVGGWSCRIRTPQDAAASSVIAEESGDLSFWFEGMDSSEKTRMNGMIGKGLTLLFIKNRNRDDWLSSAPKLTLPVYGSPVYDPRVGQEVFSRNPALQYADFLRSADYGAGQRNIPVSDANISELADHFDQIPDSIGNDGINSILIDVQVDTGKPLVDNMNIWMEGVRLYTSDYYGEFNVRVETKASVSISIEEDDLVAFPDYESGEFTERLNQLTYTIKQLVPDTSEEAEAGDLVEVDVEATFPVDNSQIHLDWLAEDGDIQSFESEELDYVTELEQAYYWAMVDARISRQPRKLEIAVNAIGWLIEVGDVVEYSSDIMAMTDTLWRVDEVSEDDGEVLLSLRSYDNTFYTPDPDAIPAPVAPAQPPTRSGLSPVDGVQVQLIRGQYYLNWTPLSSANVDWYAVQVTRDGALVVDEPKVAQPPLLLPNLEVGSHEAKVISIGAGIESAESIHAFSVDLPLSPTSVETELGNTHVILRPVVANQAFGTTYEFYFRGTDESGVRELKVSEATSAQMSGLFPDTTYYFSVRASNPLGFSDYFDVSAKTTKNAEATKDLLEGQIGFDELDIGVAGKIINNEIKVDQQEVVIRTTERTVESLSQEVFNTVSDYSSFRHEYERRILEGETLTDAVVYRDPANGLIVNKAFSYTDESFTQASILIDGVQGEVRINAEKLTATDNRITDAESEINVLAGDIELRATYTEVNQIVDGAISALEPAYSWQFNTSLDGWSGGTWNASGTITTTVDTPVSITGISFNADENPMLRVSVKKGTTWQGAISWNGGSQAIPINEPTQGDNFELVNLELLPVDGWTGTITEISILFGDVEVDSIVVGKRDSADQALEDITARVTEAEVDINALGGQIALKLDTQTWEDNKYTDSDVQVVLDAWDTSIGLTTTLTELDEANTVTKANNADLWISSADANIRAEVVAYNAEPDGINDQLEDIGAQLNSVSIELDGVENKITTQATSISGLQGDIVAGAEADFNFEYQMFLRENDRAEEGIKLAYAEENIQAVTTDQEALAQRTLDLEAITEDAVADIQEVSIAFANSEQATAIEFSNLRVEMDQGDQQSVAEANEYTRASIGYCVDNDGNVTNEEDAVTCVTAGNSWVQSPLAESVRNVQLTTKDGAKASVQEQMLVIEDDVSGNTKSVAQLSSTINDGETGLGATLTLATKADGKADGAQGDVDDLSNSFDGYRATAQLTVDANGNVGYIQLDATPDVTQIAFKADQIVFRDEDDIPVIFWDTNTKNYKFEGAVIADSKLVSPSIEMIGTQYMQISSANGFGANNEFIEWYGLRYLVDGEVDYSQITKANAITYKTVDGSAYFGGTIFSGLFKNSMTNTQSRRFVPNEVAVELGPFGTTGKPKQVLISWSFVMGLVTEGLCTPPYTQPRLSWRLERSLDDGSSWQFLISGEYNGTTEFEQDTSEVVAFCSVNEYAAGSTTFTDISTVTVDFMYRVVIVESETYYPSGDQKFSIICTEE